MEVPLRCVTLCWLGGARSLRLVATHIGLSTGAAPNEHPNEVCSGSYCEGSQDELIAGGVLERGGGCLAV